MTELRALRSLALACPIEASGPQLLFDSCLDTAPRFSIETDIHAPHSNSTARRSTVRVKQSGRVS